MDTSQTSEAARIAATQDPSMSPSARLDAIEETMIRDLDVQISKSVLYTLGEKDPTRPTSREATPMSTGPRRQLMGDDPRLQKMPAKPTLIDFFTYRWGPMSHVLQSATHALKGGQPEKVVLACLLHDISVSGFIRADHGYWGAQLVEPYVDEEITWAIRHHQALRFYADKEAGYEYPENYRNWFGDDYEPEPYIQQAYKDALAHKWYMTSRLITVNDIYSFDPTAVVDVHNFEDIIGRNFKQPAEGLGFDNSPVAHMWRTLIWPTKFL